VPSLQRSVAECRTRETHTGTYGLATRLSLGLEHNLHNTRPGHWQANWRMRSRHAHAFTVHVAGQQSRSSRAKSRAHDQQTSALTDRRAAAASSRAGHDVVEGEHFVVRRLHAHFRVAYVAQHGVVPLPRLLVCR